MTTTQSTDTVSFTAVWFVKGVRHAQPGFPSPRLAKNHARQQWQSATGRGSVPANEILSQRVVTRHA